MVENEFKIMLSVEQYQRLRSAFEWDRVITQTNHYYDTEDLSLSPRHITCRVRKIAEECFLQMKLPNGAAYSRIELEKRLGTEVPEELSEELLNELAGEYVGERLPAVKRLGALTTERCVKEFEGAELDLDRSSYFAVTDYELEIEFTDENAARELLLMVKRTAGITESAEVCTGKVHRFLQEYRKAKPQN